MTLITGKTFPVKDQLRRLGGRWNATAKGWDVPDARAAEAQRLVEEATHRGPGVASSRWPRQAPRTCLTCGSRINYGVYCGKCEYGR